MDNRDEDEQEWLAEQFEGHRSHLRAVAYRMLGSLSEADDAVQESWLRLSRADTSGVENLGGWLRTVVARVCLDQLRARAARREEPLEPGESEEMRVTHTGGGAAATAAVMGRAGGGNPEDEALLADAVGLALLVVLDTLNPAERLAFVLHDLFDVPFEEIAPIVGRTPTAARQLASRARRRVQGRGQQEEHEQRQEPGETVALEQAAASRDVSRQRTVVSAFLAASRGGDFEALLTLLDPEVVLRADNAVVSMAARSRWLQASEVHGAQGVAKQFAGRAQVARPALVNGVPGAVWAHGGRARVVFAFTIVDGKVAAIELIADPERLSRLDVAVLDD
jgi:RNA polymerase sigma-70 factor (ECF subfamily)